MLFRSGRAKSSLSDMRQLLVQAVSCLPTRLPGAPPAILPVRMRENSGMRTMTKVEWQPLADAHAAQVDAWSEGRRTRRGMRHPIDDFLWDYYSHRPAHLRRWHPGTGIALEAAAEHATWPHYVTEDGVTFLVSQINTVCFRVATF